MLNIPKGDIRSRHPLTIAFLDGKFSPKFLSQQIRQSPAFKIYTFYNSDVLMCERCNLFNKLCNDISLNEPHLYSIDFDCLICLRTGFKRYQARH